LDTPTPPQRDPASRDPGPGHAWRPGGVHLAVALLLAIAGITALLVLWVPTPVAPVATSQARAPVVAAATAGAPGPAPGAPHPSAARAPEGDADPTPDLSSYVARGDNPTVGEVIERLHQRGIYSGIGAFQPPGTSPPLVGLAVPEDFPLPKGYVRHHQSTDDGQPIEAILMFAPDFQLYDANNRPIPMPPSGVVPPELAPPGLPIRRVVIPAPADPVRPGR